MSLSRTLSGGERPVFEVERDSIVSIRHRRLQELEVDADEDKIKLAYRCLAKFYHPDVYDGRGTLEEGETAETRFIKIQAAYELLLDGEKRRQYDSDNRVNPMKLKYSHGTAT